MKLKRTILAAAIGALALIGIAVAQPVITRVVSIGTSDLIQVIPGGAPSAQSVYATSALLGNYAGTLTGNNPENALIGGDSTTNLWQRATSGSSVTTTFTYGGPDRWGYWSGASTAMTVSRTTTAGDLPGALTYLSGFKMARTSGQTGVVQMCMLQALETANSLAFSGQTAEIDFHASAGANFSAASSVMTAYLVSGTGTDEGGAKFAFSLNAGGGGSAATGAVATGVNVTIGTANQRYTVAIPVPSGATQVAVALCYTPVGTAGTNDYVAFSGIQLTRNSALTTVAGTAGVALSVNDTRAKAFARRSQATETVLQQRYYYQITESATAIQPVGICAMSTTSIANCMVNFPVTMRTAPTMTYATGFQASATTASSSATACTGITTTATLTSNAAGPQGVIIDCASSAGFGAAGTAGFMWHVGTRTPSGAIKASAEL